MTETARTLPRLSLRTKLVSALLLLEAAGLAFMVWQGHHLDIARSESEFQTSLSQLRPLLNASLAPAVATGDRARVEAVIAEVQTARGLSYLVVKDDQGSVIAVDGWKIRESLPAPVSTLESSLATERFDTLVPLSIAGRPVGILQAGISTRAWRESIDRQFDDAVFKATSAFFMSVLLFLVVVNPIARRLTRLRSASEKIAAGDYSIRIPQEDVDDIGLLARAFNGMTGQVQSRVAELEDANALQAKTSESLHAEKSRMLSLLSAMSFGVVFIDPSNRIIYSNPAFAEVWSIPRDEHLQDKGLFDALQGAEDPVKDLKSFTAELPEMIKSRDALATHELKLVSGRILRLRVCPVESDAGESLGAVLIHEDITLARESETQLAFLAERDPLTGLFNRRSFENELTEKMDNAAREKQQLALFFFDLDEFKSVNDLFGHRMGDTVLLQVAGEIRSHLRRNEFFARIGGDEFALLVSNASEERIRILADRLMGVVGAMSFSLGEVRLSLTSSLGIAMFPDHATTPQELIAHADAAMYQAKDAGKNTWRIFQPDHSATLRQRSLVTWNDRIRHALRNEGFEIHLQGIFDTTTRERHHDEALIRMQDEDGGKLLQPGAFIGFAEKSNLIIDVDRWVVENVIDILAADEKLGSVAVNISGRSFDEPAIPAFIRSELASRGVDPGRLLIEITETAAIRDMRDAQRFIFAVHELGCKVCLDDFGAGFSTFAYIKQLPVDVIKIDGLFVRNLARERDNQIFVKAMLDIARGFDKKVIAESVEDENTLDLLRRFGVDMAQGFLLERPYAARRTPRVATPVAAAGTTSA